MAFGAILPLLGRAVGTRAAGGGLGTFAGRTLGFGGAGFGVGQLFGGGGGGGDRPRRRRRRGLTKQMMIDLNFLATAIGKTAAANYLLRQRF